MRLEKARSIATCYVEAMQPYCEVITIGGSIRRGCNPEVKDIEIVCVPKIVITGDRSGLFGEECEQNLLYDWAMGCGIRWIKPGASQIVDWIIKPDGKYWRGVIAVDSETMVKLDVFLTTVENFGTTLLIRTGSLEFNQAIMRHARMIGRACAGNHFHLNGEPQSFDDEAGVFEFLGLEYVPPGERIDAGSVHSRRMLKMSERPLFPRAELRDWERR